MAYGKIKSDAIIYDNSGSDVEIAISAIPSATDLAGKAPLASPALTGTPTAPTAGSGTNTTQIATTAFVTTDLAGKAPLSSPALTGTPTAPTAGSGTNTTQIATTAFVAAATSGGVSLSAANTWTAGQRAEITTLTDGSTITPNLNDSNNYVVVLAGNRTIANPTNITAGQSGSIFVTQDGTGSRTAAWGSYWDWAGGAAPTLSTGASQVDRIDYIVRSSSSIPSVATLNNS